MDKTDSESLTATAVENIEVGDLVDLDSCPCLRSHKTAKELYATVASVERETGDRVAIGYEGIDQIGYRIGTVLLVLPT